MKLQYALLFGLAVCAGLAATGHADDAPVYGDPGQKLAPPPVKREPPYKPELIKGPPAEIREHRAKMRVLGEKLTDASLNYPARLALQREFAAEAQQVKTLEAQIAAGEAEEIAHAKADVLAAKERRKKDREADRKARAEKAAKRAADRRSRTTSYDAPDASAPRKDGKHGKHGMEKAQAPAASPAPEASPSPSASPAPAPSASASASPRP